MEKQRPVPQITTPDQVASIVSVDQAAADLLVRGSPRHPPETAGTARDTWTYLVLHSHLCQHLGGYVT